MRQRMPKRLVVHRDLKPSNILITADGEPKLLDFGLAGLRETSESDPSFVFSVASHVSTGTWEYMSPEQALGKPVDARCDLYSLGVVFYEMLTGSRPFKGADAFETAILHVKGPIPILPEPLRRFQPVIDRVLAKTPQARFTSAEELARAVQNVANAGKTTSWRQWRRSPWLFAALLVIVLAVLAALLAWWY